ncbi:MAG TPA: hypothetical protein QGF05_08435 [Dehalococcoidia bacterium]|nr:hypothetical protein [Dehalococcoidia bacterium]
MTAPAGLCDRCAHARVVTSARESRFLRCERSDTEAEYARYPQLPVRSCEGFSALEPASTAEEPLIENAPLPLVGAESRQPLFDRVGGRGAVERIVAALYDGIETDPKLRPLFPVDLHEGRVNQTLFFEQWLGGEPRYTALRGSPQLRRRHLHFPIDEETATRWLGHMAAALRACDVDEIATKEILTALEPLARHLINQVPAEG